MSQNVKTILYHGTIHEIHHVDIVPIYIQYVKAIWEKLK